MEEATQANEEATPSSPTRPEWLPEKFENPEAFAKSYGELESKIGQREEDLRTSINQQIQDDFHYLHYLNFSCYSMMYPVCNMLR